MGFFMPRVFRSGIHLMLLAALCAPALAQQQPSDYAREKRWADEIVPAIVVGEPVWLDAPRTQKFLGIYTEAKGAKTAIILAHGLGVNPDYGLIGELRVRLAEAGYTTLSIQMPILAADAPAARYPTLFWEGRALCRGDVVPARERLPEARDRLAQHGLAHGEPLHLAAPEGAARGLGVALDLERRVCAAQAA
jgi:hypothetical protein